MPDSSSGVCEKELNAQLQMLQSRVKTLEKNVAALGETQLTDIGQTVAAFMSIITTAPEGIVTYIANQLILKLASAALGMAENKLSSMASEGGGSVGDLMADISNVQDVLEQIYEILTTPMLDWSQLQFLFSVENIRIPPFPFGAMAAIDAAIEAVAVAQAALNADPGNADLQAALAAKQSALAAMQNAQTAMNNLVNCRTLTSVIGL